MGLAAAAVSVALIGSANATPTLFVQVNGDTNNANYTTSLNPSGLTDTGALTGYSYGYNGTGFGVSGVVNGILALGSPNLNSNAQTITIGSFTGNMITVAISETGLTQPLGAYLIGSSFTANSLTGTVTSVKQSSYVNANNVAFATTDLIGTHTFNGLGTDSSQITTPNLTGPYSLTQIYQVSVTPGTCGSGTTCGSTNDTINTYLVPEPGTMAVLLVGLLGLTFVYSRRRQA